MGSKLERGGNGCQIDMYFSLEYLTMKACRMRHRGLEVPLTVALETVRSDEDSSLIHLTNRVIISALKNLGKTALHSFNPISIFRSCSPVAVPSPYLRLLNTQHLTKALHRQLSFSTRTADLPRSSVSVIGHPDACGHC